MHCASKQIYAKNLMPWYTPLGKPSVNSSSLLHSGKAMLKWWACWNADQLISSPDL